MILSIAVPKIITYDTTIPMIKKITIKKLPKVSTMIIILITISPAFLKHKIPIFP